MSKYLCVYLPNWSITVARRTLPNHHKPLLLVENHAGQSLVCRCCEQASAKGVHTPLPLELARALVPDAEVLPFRVRHDARCLYRLGRWFLRVSPVVGLEREFVTACSQNALHALSELHWGIIVDLQGTERLHHGFPALLAMVEATFLRWRTPARLAVAPTIGAAWALSRFGARSSVIFTAQQTHELATALFDLPLQALRLDGETLESLRSLGVTTIGMVRSLPRRKLPARFGSNPLVRLAELDGTAVETFRALSTPQPLCLRRGFDPPLLSHQSVERALSDLLTEIVRILAARRQQAQRIELFFFGLSVEGERQTLKKEMSLYAETESSAHLLSLIVPLVEKVRFAQGVSEIVLWARDLVRSVAKQQRLFRQGFCVGTNASTAQAAAELLNHFTVRCGSDAVCQLVFTPSYLPERAFGFHSIESLRGKAHLKGGEMAKEFALSRPSTLFTVPEPATAVSLLPDKPPVQLVWRNAALRIVRGIGPERIAEEWWHRELGAASLPSQREYFRVQTGDGRWLWVFRDSQTMKWFVHGIWS